MSDKYDLFSKYYRQLIHATKHVENENNAVRHVISDLQIDMQHSILDAACGSGDLLYYLKNNGYNNVSGLDASIGMINKAKELLPNIPYFHTCWESMNNHVLDRYDYIFILSISLLHALQEDFPLVFRNIYQVLNVSGVFVFDNRFWNIHQGEILQVNRSIDRYSNEVVINIDNVEIVIDSICRYLDDRQYIKYRIRYEEKEEYIEVSYSRITTETLINMLYDAGFSKVKTNHFAEWPYEILYAFK